MTRIHDVERVPYTESMSVISNHWRGVYTLQPATLTTMIIRGSHTLYIVMFIYVEIGGKHHMSNIDLSSVIVQHIIRAYRDIATANCPSVCPSVTLRYRDQIG